MSGYIPTPEDAQFVGEVAFIDVGLAQIVTDQLRRGIPLRTVRATLEDALKIVRTIRKDPA